MDKNMYLINRETGTGADFQVLDWIQMEGRVYVVLMPATETDREICGEMMEPSDGWSVCILEVGEDRDGRGQYFRVEDHMLDQVFQVFRRRNLGK